MLQFAAAIVVTGLLAAAPALANDAHHPDADTPNPPPSAAPTAPTPMPNGPMMGGRMMQMMGMMSGQGRMTGAESAPCLAPATPAEPAPG